jgi:hypothetical protein
MKKSTLRLLIREAIEQVFEAEIKYNVGDRVEIDSSTNGGIGTVELASHPTYAIKFDQTGVTDSFHFSDLRPFNDEEEADKNANINTGLDESEGSFPDQLKGNDGIIWKKNWEKNNQANYGAFYKGHDIESGGITFDNVNTLQRKVKSYVLSNNLYDKLKYAKPLDENINPTDSITLDVPLFIRMLEYAREDAKTDMDLHNVTDNALKLSTTGKTLTMADYNQITSKK